MAPAAVIPLTSVYGSSRSHPSHIRHAARHEVLLPVFTAENGICRAQLSALGCWIVCSRQSGSSSASSRVRSSDGRRGSKAGAGPPSKGNDGGDRTDPAEAERARRRLSSGSARRAQQQATSRARAADARRRSDEAGSVDARVLAGGRQRPGSGKALLGLRISRSAIAPRPMSR